MAEEGRRRRRRRKDNDRTAQQWEYNREWKKEATITKPCCCCFNAVVAAAAGAVVISSAIVDYVASVNPLQIPATVATPPPSSCPSTAVPSLATPAAPVANVHCTSFCCCRHSRGQSTRQLDCWLAFVLPHSLARLSLSPSLFLDFYALLVPCPFYICFSRFLIIGQIQFQLNLQSATAAARATSN